jgi:hypothetical protein
MTLITLIKKEKVRVNLRESVSHYFWVKPYWYGTNKIQRP